MEAWGVPLVTFLIGVVTGASAKYYADKLTDRRRDQETRDKARDRFSSVANQMPELIAEMKADFLQFRHEAIREFVVLRRKGNYTNSPQLRFQYFEDQHENLRGKINVLENHGYVQGVRVGDTPTYRISEEFWDYVLRH